MDTIRSHIILIGLTLFLSACNTERVDLGQSSNPPIEAEAYWARDQFDLQRLGPLLERSHTPQEFEAYLNEDDGINNLDLNGDGYVDYLSVEEFYDRGPYERGLSIFDRFGPDAIQEIASIIFYRDDPSWAGARVVVIGNDNIYGDNVYYETNWFDRSLDLVTYVYTDHDPYRSPYYFGYYPADYEVFEVVETPVYVTRVQQLYPEPVLVFTERPTFISKVKIKSPNSGKHFDQIYAKLSKPTKEQERFFAENRGKRPDRVMPERVKSDPPGKAEGPPEQDKDPRLPPGKEKNRAAEQPGREDPPGMNGQPPGQAKQQPQPAAKSNTPAGRPQSAKQGGSKGKKKS